MNVRCERWEKTKWNIKGTFSQHSENIRRTLGVNVRKKL